MSDPANLFDDPNASHPLDLLINAISGSGEEYQIPPEAREGEFNLEQLLNSGAHNEPTDTGKRKRDDEEDVSDTRQSKIAKTVTSHIVEATNLRREVTTSRQRYTPSTFSTIEVWHPKSAQKGYGKERRMLNPPPILRVTGPLLPSLTKVTLTATFSPEGSDGPFPLSSQTHRIPLVYNPAFPAPTGLKSKRFEKEEKKMKLREQASRYGFGQTLPFERRKMAEKEREALREGLSFPALWVGEGVGRTKEFRLELILGHPRDEGLDAPNASPSLSGSIDPSLQPDSADYAQPGSSTAPTDLFPTHETLDDASNDVVQQLTNNDERLLHATTQQQTPSTGTQRPASERPSQAPDPTLSRSWANFTSAPLSVVSKPSQKTVKARSMASCFTVDDSFSLWVRIHGQTVRTKYMKLDATGDEPHLTTRTGQWTPFRFQVYSRAGAAEPSDQSTGGRKRAQAQPTNILTYGSIGCLVDLQSGIKTEPMRLVKVEKNEHFVGSDYGHPVSDLQRVGFVRLVDGNDDYTGGERWYLSAPGARMGGAESIQLPTASLGGSATADTRIDETDLQTLESVAKSSTPPPPTAKKQRKKKTKRFALAEAVIAEDAGGAEFALTWTKASRYEADRARLLGKERVTRLELCEKVEDWMFWTLGGVDSFSYSFFDGSPTSDTESLPTAPIDPIPQSLLAPSFRPETNTLQLTLSDFFTSEALGRSEVYDVFLGPLGPLSISTYRSMAPVNAGSDDDVNQHFEAVPYFDTQPNLPYRNVRSDYPCNRPHVIVVVDMPRAEEIIRTMQECFAEAQYQATSTLHTVSGEPTEAEGWITTSDNPAPATNSLSGQLGRSGHNDPPSGQLAEKSGGHEGDQQFSTDDLGLEQMLNESRQQAGQHHNVDDIAAVLAAHASEPDFSLAHIDEAFLTSNLDPSLQDPQSARPSEITATDPTSTSAPAEPSAQGEPMETLNQDPNEPATGEMSAHDIAPPALRLSKPEQGDKKVEMVPLPLLLIRKTDGVGFGVGRNVVAERVDSKAPGDKPRWGLRVVSD